MANQDFQDRLSRIGSRPAQNSYYATAQRQPAPKRPGIASAALAGAIFALGVKLVRDTNQNYENVRDSAGAESAALLGLLALVLMLVGAILMLRFLWRTIRPAPAAPRERHEASGFARFFYSTLGLGLGASASAIMFTAVVAKHTESRNETADMLAANGLSVGILLLLLALLLGFLGLFFRGRGLGRVPVYFFVGSVIVWAGVRLSRVNLLEWEPLIAALQ